jgi:hypothetical protein
MQRVTAYTVSDEGFFVGTVALLNSLRLVGARFPLVVLDGGLSDEQRERLALHATVVPLPAGAQASPTLLKAYAAPADADGVVIVLDSDMVLTQPLTGVVADAEAGRVCVFTDGIETQRWFDEWYDAFALPRPEHGAHGGRYGHRSVNSGFVAFSAEHWPSLLTRWRRACDAIPAGGTAGEGAELSGPFWDGDQDALNAILKSLVPPPRLAIRRTYVTREMRHVRVDLGRCEATCGGCPVGLLHSLGSPKPWQSGGWRRVRRDAYVRLLRRLLFTPDVELRLPPAAVPPWLWPDARGGTLLAALGAENEARTLPRRARLRIELSARHVFRDRRSDAPEAPPISVA